MLFWYHDSKDLASKTAHVEDKTCMILMHINSVWLYTIYPKNYTHEVRLAVAWCCSILPKSLMVTSLALGTTTWWRHQMETISALLALCKGNSPVTGEFPSQRPMMRKFDIFYDLRLNKRLSKQSWGWWFDTPSHPLWRHCNDTNDPVLTKQLWCMWVNGTHEATENQLHNQLEITKKNIFVFTGYTVIRIAIRLGETIGWHKADRLIGAQTSFWLYGGVLTRPNIMNLRSYESQVL